MEKPRIYVNFAKGNLPETLPTLAFEALGRENLPVQALVNDLRNYGKQKQLANQRAAPLMRIVSKYVDVRPLNYRDMFVTLGPREALRYIPGEPPPDKIWEDLARFNRDDPELARHFNNEMLMLIARAADRYAYSTLMVRYRYLHAKRNGTWQEPSRVPTKALIQ